MALSANIQNIASTYSTPPVQAPKKYNPSIFDKLSTNISQQKHKDLLNKIKAIRAFISAAPQDENTGNLLSYL